MKRLFTILVALAAAALLVYAFVPKPVEVDVAAVGRGPMQVTVNQEGKTQVKDRYIVAAPLAGQLERIIFEAGDAVEAGKTVLAVIQPTPPALLDVRAREEAEARVRAAEAGLTRWGPEILRAEAQLEQARIELARVQRLADVRASSQQELDDKNLAVRVNESNLRVARAGQDVARFELQQAQAVLERFTARATTQPARFEVSSPISGKVLRVIQESTTPVTPGTALLEVGDVRDIEAIIDVLSRDAVRVRPGAKVYFDRWGGDEPLVGVVRRIEPSGFTKISALGVEEQRVNVIADLTIPSGAPAPGDYYRVDARIVIWESADALQLPSGALFRKGSDWCVYTITADRAALRKIDIGRLSGLSAEVRSGIAAGEEVILHPSDKIADGVAVTRRAAR